MSEEKAQQTFFLSEPPITPIANQPAVEPYSAPRNAEPRPSGGDTPHHVGHRERMKERFQKVGHDGFVDYEMPEMLLYRSIRRGDTKPLVNALLTSFGSLAEVLGATEHLLQEVKGCGPAFSFDLEFVSALTHRVIRSDMPEKAVPRSSNKVIEYCIAAMAHEPREQLRILCRDKKVR